VIPEGSCLRKIDTRRWLPALVQDGLLDPFDTAVGLWSAGADEAMAGAELGRGLAEDRGAKL
jgi:hypothetical protein